MSRIVVGFTVWVSLIMMLVKVLTRRLSTVR